MYVSKKKDSFGFYSEAKQTNKCGCKFRSTLLQNTRRDANWSVGHTWSGSRERSGFWTVGKEIMERGIDLLRSVSRGNWMFKSSKIELEKKTVIFVIRRDSYSLVGTKKKRKKLVRQSFETLLAKD